MSSGLKIMKEHVKAVSNIKKITSSMKVVAAAKYAKSEKKLRSARPYGVAAYYFVEVSKIKSELVSPHITVLAVTSDRGLCGSMHAKVCKQVKSNIQILTGKTYDIVCVGERARSILQFDLKDNISYVVNGIGHKAPKFSDASKIVIKTFKNDSHVQGNIIFPKFKNMVSFDVEQLVIYGLPLMLNSKVLMRYELEADDDTISYFEFIQASIMYYALCETFLVELSSRITAMSNASKNASTMTQKLLIEMNRKRQSLITNELIDIVSGAEVLK